MTPTDFVAADHPRACLEKGKVRAKKGDYLAAIREFDTIIQRFQIPKQGRTLPNFALFYEAYCERGLAHFQLKKNEQAINDFTRVIEGPKVIEELYRGNPHFGEARHTVLAKLTRWFNLARLGRGQVYARLLEFDRTIEDYTWVIELDPDHFEAYYRRALAYHRIGESARRDADFQRANEINPDAFAQLQPYLPDCKAHATLSDVRFGKTNSDKKMTK